MDNQIQLYHDLTTFYLGTEEELRAEIARLRDQIANVKKKLKEQVEELRAEARRRYSEGYEKGCQDGCRGGYERGYREAVDKAEWVYEPEDLDNNKLNIEKAHQRGWTKARKRYMVTYLCSVCSKIIEVTSENEKSEIRKYMMEHRWGHKPCIDKAHRKL